MHVCDRYIGVPSSLKRIYWRVNKPRWRYQKKEGTNETKKRKKERKEERKKEGVCTNHMVQFPPTQLVCPVGQLW